MNNLNYFEFFLFSATVTSLLNWLFRSSKAAPPFGVLTEKSIFLARYDLLESFKFQAQLLLTIGSLEFGIFLKKLSDAVM